MSQTWRRLTFLHWPYEPALVQPLLPPGLVLDTFDSSAWIGLVPFEICNLRAIPHFPETNVRTYVIGPDGFLGVGQTRVVGYESAIKIFFKCSHPAINPEQARIIMGY